LHEPTYKENFSPVGDIQLFQKVFSFVKLNFGTLISEKGMDKGVGRLKERGVITGKDLGRETFISLLLGISFENFIYFVRKSLT